jgi:NitT/TauT family transport system substrate-binding protein
MAFVLAGCDPVDPDGPKSIKVVVPDGAPLLSLTKMWAEDFGVDDGYEISYEKLTGADQLTAALMLSDPDFAIAPINVCAKMYNDGKGYRFAGVSIWGIMHIVSNQSISTVAELKGQNVFAFAKAGTPGITIRSILAQNNIVFSENVDGTVAPNEVNIIYLSEAGDVRNAIVAGTMGGVEVKFALLPEPVATAIAGATASLTHGPFTAKINLQTEWKAKNDGEMYPQAGLIFHERLLENDKAFVDKFIALAEMSTTWANDNPELAGNAAKEELGSTAIPGGAPVKAAVNAGRLPLVFTYAKDAKAAVEAYLTIIKNDSVNSANLIGGKLPDDEFYYSK